ncbi:hypothetical protein IGI04_026391, partial [Brassica rapa subsp. trilocularis]
MPFICSCLPFFRFQLPFSQYINISSDSMLHHHTRKIHHSERGMLTDSIRLLLVLTTVTFTEILPSTKAIVSFKVPDNSSGKQSPYRSFEAEPIDRCNSHSRYTSHLVLTLDMTHPPKLSPSTMLETLQSTLNHYSPLLTQSIIECIYHYFISLNPGDYLNYKKSQLFLNFVIFLTSTLSSSFCELYLSLYPNIECFYLHQEPKQNNLRQNTLALYCLHEITM